MGREPQRRRRVRAAYENGAENGKENRYMVKRKIRVKESEKIWEKKKNLERRERAG